MNQFYRLTGRVAMRLLDAHRGENYKYAYARRTEQWMREPVEWQTAHQLQRLRSIVEYAYRNTEFYRDRFDRVGFAPGDLSTFDDVARLPAVTKSDLIDSEFSTLSSDPTLGQPGRACTGGSTGQRLQFYRDAACNNARRGIDLAINRRYGWRDGEWQGWLWGATMDLVKPVGLKARIVRNAATRIFFIDAGHLDNEAFTEFAIWVRKHRPSLIGAYSTLAVELARRIEQGQVPEMHVPIVVCTAEPLSEEERSYIESIFADHCHCRYGAREFGSAGFECIHRTGYHLFADSVFMESETIDQLNQPVGRLLVTDLLNRAMPLIRYEVGDLGRIEHGPCACGLQSPRLVDLRGRMTDLFERSDGSLLPGMILVNAIGQLEIRSKVQLVQTAVGKVTINCEGDPYRHPIELLSLQKLLKTQLGEPLELTIRRVDQIKRSASGKYPYVVSLIRKPQGVTIVAPGGPN